MSRFASSTISAGKLVCHGNITTWLSQTCSRTKLLSITMTTSMVKDDNSLKWSSRSDQFGTESDEVIIGCRRWRSVLVVAVGRQIDQGIKCSCWFLHAFSIEEELPNVPFVVGGLLGCFPSFVDIFLGMIRTPTSWVSCRRHTSFLRHRDVSRLEQAFGIFVRQGRLPVAAVPLSRKRPIDCGWRWTGNDEYPVSLSPMSPRV
jgi:hypothetical protein